MLTQPAPRPEGISMRIRALLTALTLLAIATASLLPVQALAQCILINPSFEVAGSGGQVFGGWNQFGNYGSVNFASHGSKAARVTGPNYGGWDVSGFWQQMDSSAGEQWLLTGKVAHSSANPLTADSKAIVNIEWWDASDMISYESHDVAVPSDPTDEYMSFSILSGNAPSGTVKMHALFAVLQSPGAAPPDVYYDQVTVFSQDYPTIEDMQWNDFPGGRTVDFSGYTWRVKGPGYYGPGPNSFSDSASHVWVDGGQLHLTVKKVGSTWYSTEVTLTDTLGYGDYIFTTLRSYSGCSPGSTAPAMTTRICGGTPTTSSTSSSAAGETPGATSPSLSPSHGTGTGTSVASMRPSAMERSPVTRCAGFPTGWSAAAGAEDRTTSLPRT
jgi:hypothetical protein